MKLILFTYPNCPKCESLKECLKETDLEWTVYNLVNKEGKLRIREFLKVLNRDDTGGIIIPTLILKEGEHTTVLNSREELKRRLND